MLQQLYVQIAKKSKISSDKVARIMRGVGLLLADHTLSDLTQMGLDDIGGVVQKNILVENDDIVLGDVITVAKTSYDLMNKQPAATVFSAIHLLVELSKQSVAEGIDLPMVVEPDEPVVPVVSPKAPTRPPARTATAQRGR